MAGAPVTRETLKRVCRLAAKGEVFTPYGATEALPVTLISASEIFYTKAQCAKGGELGTLVGKPLAGVEVRIIEVEDRPLGTNNLTPLAPLEIGEIIVRGPNVSPAYYQRPEADAAGKIKDGSSFWHRMGDMGYLDEAGNIYFCGRKAHAVYSGQKTLYSIPTEKVFNEHPRVKRSALVSLGENKGAGIVIEPEAGFLPESAAEREKFISELKQLGSASAVSADIKHFFFHPSFPVDGRHNAKIFRDKLSLWVQSRAG